MKANAKRKVLIISPHEGIGDYILHLPVLQLLYKRYNCEIYYLTRPDSRSASFLERVPMIKKVIYKDLNPTNFRLGHLGALLIDLPQATKFMLMLDRKLHLDWLFLSDPWRTLFTYLSFLPIRAEWKAIRTLRKLFLPGCKSVTLNQKEFLPCQLKKLLPAGEELELEQSDLSFLLEKPPSSIVANLLRQHPPLIVLHPFGSNYPQLRAPVEKWGEFLSELKRRTPACYRVVAVGTERDFSSELEKEGWMNLCDKLSIENLIGKTSLSDLAYLLSNCKLFIGHDSGISHIAWAFAAPRLILYRFPDTHFSSSMFYPYEDNLRLFLPTVKCFPCGSKLAEVCPLKKCRTAYEWDNILSSAEELLSLYAR